MMRNIAIGFLLLVGIVNAVAFFYSPQPYGLFGFLNFLFAYILWKPA